MTSMTGETGHCRCGEVVFRISALPLLTMACHCIGCQHMSASAFSLSAAIPLEGFALTQGETVIGGMHGAAHHHFCPHCKSWLFTRGDDMPFVNIRPTMLENRSWTTPFIETCLSEKLPWARTPARHGFDGFPPMEAYEGLIAEFRATIDA